MTAAFAAWLTQLHYSPATVRNYVGYVHRAQRAVGPLEAVDTDELYGWWATLPNTAPSRNGARKALIAWYRHTGGANPAVGLPQLAANPGLPRPVGEATFGALRAAAVTLGGEHQVLAVLLGSTGCRITEARTARWDAFTFDRPASWRIAGKGAACRGPKLRDVVLHESAVTVLRSWRRECSSRVWLFPSSRRAGPQADGTIRRRVYEIADAAGVDDHVNPHRWRHTFATAALDATGNLAAVQDVLGHADPATTRRYSRVGLGRMLEVVDAAVNYGNPRLHAVG